MDVSSAATKVEWIDPDDAPELTDEMLEMGQRTENGRVTRPATGVLTKDGMKRVPPYIIPMPGRPPDGAEAKKQVTLRLDADVLEKFRATGPGWQTRINEALRKAVAA
jgi:uncharacterized protein (DUF4415 family)